jgi:hypothetical protein
LAPRGGLGDGGELLQPRLGGMIAALKSLEKFLGDTRENLLTEYHPKDRNIIDGRDDIVQGLDHPG